MTSTVIAGAPSRSRSTVQTCCTPASRLAAPGDQRALSGAGGLAAFRRTRAKGSANIARPNRRLMIRMKYALSTVAAAIIAFAQGSMAQAPSSAIGVVIMHGKGGSPSGFVSNLASSLEQKGYLVANLEMPWSGRREYDVGVDVAESEIDTALASLRAKGASKVFVAGHSQGGLFAIHYGGKHPVDGIIAIAPGGNVANPIFRMELGQFVEQARKLVAE